MTTTPIPIPENLVGKVGMVAMLQRLSPEDDGKWVAVRRPVGTVTSLVGSKFPVFAWEVLVLGEPVQINRKPCREIYVADRCLKPVCEISAAKVESFVKARAQQDFDDALNELKQYLKDTTLTPAEFEGFVDKAGNQFGIERALENVPTAVVLDEIGFKLRENSGWPKNLCWFGVNDGWQIKITAQQDWFGRWNLYGEGRSERTILCHEAIVPDEDLRGKTMARVLSIWRNAYGREAPVPDCLSLGVVFEEHQEAMRRLDPGMPHLNLDGFMFRACVKWLRQNHSARQDNDYLLMSFFEGLLRLRTKDNVLGCPAHGIWTDDCQVSLNDLLRIDPWSLRGRAICVERALESVSFNGYVVEVI